MVVLPTPPFWFATAMRIIASPSPLFRPRSCEFGVGDTLFHVEHTLPRLPGFDQFRCRASPLRQRPDGLSCGQMCGYLQQIGHFGYSTGGDYVVFPSSALGLAVKDRSVESQRFAELVEKVGSQPSRFDERHGAADDAGDYDPRQSGSRTYVDPGRSGLGFKAHQLCRIEDMPVPKMIERRSRNKVLDSVLLPQKGCIGLQLFECFT